MKYVVVLGDGMADWKIKDLGNKTLPRSRRHAQLE